MTRKLSETAERLREGGSESEAGIFEAHVEMAEDPEFQSDVEERVRDLTSPEAAVISVGEEYASMFAGMEDEYMAARADDVRDVASQIAAELMGGGATGLESLAEPSVILAVNLAPSDTARIPKGMGLGFLISEGSKTSHVSIMARSMGIPAVVGVGSELDKALNAEVVALDGGEGYAIADPDPQTLSAFEDKQKQMAAEAALSRNTSTSKPAQATVGASRFQPTSALPKTQRRHSRGGLRGWGSSARSSFSWSERSCPRRSSMRFTARWPRPLAISPLSSAPWMWEETRTSRGGPAS